MGDFPSLLTFKRGRLKRKVFSKDEIGIDSSLGGNYSGGSAMI
jgi:hypothetical protein